MMITRDAMIQLSYTLTSRSQMKPTCLDSSKMRAPPAMPEPAARDDVSEGLQVLV